jgi:nicotinamide mononucleotide adenylyltransferase
LIESHFGVDSGVRFFFGRFDPAHGAHQDTGSASLRCAAYLDIGIGQMPVPSHHNSFTLSARLARNT